MSAATVTVQDITGRRRRSPHWRRLVWVLALTVPVALGLWYWQGQASGTVAVRYTTTEVAKADITVITMR